MLQMLPSLFMGAASAGQAANQARAQQEAQYQNMMANAAQMRYSPWTGMKTDMMQAKGYTPEADALAAGLSGGFKGAMFGKEFSNPVKKPIDTQEELKANPATLDEYFKRRGLA